MSDQPPDAKALDQTHDWAAERGLQTVDVLRPSLFCPHCMNAMTFSVASQDEPDKAIIYHGGLGQGTCPYHGKRWKVRIEHLIERYPCEELAPEPAAVTEAEIMSRLLGMRDRFVTPDGSRTPYFNAFLEMCRIAESQTPRPTMDQVFEYALRHADDRVEWQAQRVVQPTAEVEDEYGLLMQEVRNRIRAAGINLPDEEQFYRPGG